MRKDIVKREISHNYLLQIDFYPRIFYFGKHILCLMESKNKS
ncbi:hypothetical protein FORC066_2510 [Yersinia enterocolitica]|nr:hypothetical protein FORC066_2510 [Yersinia enterocolitica]